MRIGELAARTGATVRSIRHYEAEGVLRPARGANGYREFGEPAVELVARIRVLLRNGFTLDEIRAVAVDLDEGNLDAVCADVAELYRAKLAEIGARIEELESLRSRIRARLGEIESQESRR